MSLSRRDAKRIDRSLQKGEHLIRTQDTSLEYIPSEENTSYDPGSWESWDPEEEIYDSEMLGEAIDILDQISSENQEDSCYDLMGSGGDFEFRDRYYPWLE